MGSKTVYKLLSVRSQRYIDELIYFYYRHSVENLFVDLEAIDPVLVPLKLIQDFHAEHALEITLFWRVGNCMKREKSINRYD